MAAVLACAVALAVAPAALAQESFTVVRASASGDSSVTFTTDDVSGNFVDPDERDQVGQREPLPDDPSAPGIDQPTFDQTGNLLRLCGCTNAKFDFTPRYDDIRGYSDRFMADGDKKSKKRLSNLVWAWGQFIDHDVVATVDLEDNTGRAFNIELKDGGRSATMKLHRLDSDPAGKCRAPKVINTPFIDAGTVYGPNEEYLQQTLREPGSCKLRVSRGDLLPVTTKKDAKTGKHLFVAGDPRVNEHAILTTMHTVFMREHNRICDVLAGAPAGSTAGSVSRDVDFEEQDDVDSMFGDEVSKSGGSPLAMPHGSPDDWFEMARRIVAAKMQQITVRHFLPAIGISEKKLRSYKPRVGDPDISVEFQIAYRFGHDMIPNRIGKFDVVKLFDGEKFYRITSARGSAQPGRMNFEIAKLMQAAAGNAANEIDGKFSSALRNSLFGMFGEDLASRNLFRGRELGVPGYARLAKCFGTKPDNKVAKESDDAFLGLLRENKNVGNKALGPTMERILVDQFHRITFGPQGRWWENDHLISKAWAKEIGKTTLASVINDNTLAKLKGNGFKA